METAVPFEVSDLPPSLLYCVEKSLLRSMTPEESKGYIVSMRMEGESSSPSPVLSEGYMNQMKAVKETAIYQIMEARLGLVPKPYGEVSSFGALMFLSYLSNGNPGNAVMWAYTLKELYRIYKQTVGLDLLSRTKTFGYGMPNSKGLQTTWDLQKGYMLTKEVKQKLDGQAVDNLLDLMFPWTTGLDEPTNMQDREGE